MVCFVKYMGNGTNGLTKYKIVILVFKCINNLAPSYLYELLNIRDTKRHSLRVDNDFFGSIDDCNNTRVTLDVSFLFILKTNDTANIVIYSVDILNFY